MVEKTEGEPGAHQWPATNNWSTLSRNVVIECTSPYTGIKIKTFVVIDTDSTGSYRYNYHHSHDDSLKIDIINMSVKIENKDSLDYKSTMLHK